MALLRFVILQTILVAGGFSLWIKGLLEPAISGGSQWFVVGVSCIAAFGLFLIAAKRLEDATKLLDLLPIIAVIAMQVGILGALAIMAQALMSSGDPAKAVGGFFAALSTALHVSVAALASYLWLRVTLWLAHGE